LDLTTRSRYFGDRRSLAIAFFFAVMMDTSSVWIDGGVIHPNLRMAPCEACTFVAWAPGWPYGRDQSGSSGVP
jgi:hypothetical protein